MTQEPSKNQQNWTRLAWLSFVMNGCAAVLGGAVLPDLIKSFSLSPFWGGMFIAIPAIGITLAGLTGGLVVETVGVRRLLILSLAGLAICLAAITLAPGLEILLISAFLFGCANGMTEMCGNAVITGLYPERAAAKLNGLHFFYGIGACLSPLTVALTLSQGFAWRLSYWIVAGLLVVLTCRILFQSELTFEQARQTQPAILFALFRQPLILQVWLGAILLLSVEQGITGWLTTYLREIEVLPAQLASVGLAFFWFAMLIGRYLNTKLPGSTSYYVIILGEVLGGVTALGIVLFSRQFTLSLIGVGLTGLFMAGLYSTLLAYGCEKNPVNPGVISGIFVTGVGAGKLCGPALIGLAANQVGISEAMNLTLGLFIGLGLLFFVPASVGWFRKTMRLGSM